MNLNEFDKLLNQSEKNHIEQFIPRIDQMVYGINELMSLGFKDLLESPDTDTEFRWVVLTCLGIACAKFISNKFVANDRLKVVQKLNEQIQINIVAEILKREEKNG